MRTKTVFKIKGYEDGLLTSNDVADFLRVHLSSVRRWTRKGKLKGYRLGRRGDWRYMRQDVIDFLYTFGNSADSDKQ